MKGYTLFILSYVVCGNIKIRNEKHEQSLTMVNLILKKTNHINGFLTYASYKCNIYDQNKILINRRLLPPLPRLHCTCSQKAASYYQDKYII